MRQLLQPFCYSLLIMGLLACHSSKPAYHRSEKDWATQAPKSVPDDLIDYTVYLVGDAGKASETPLEPTLELLKSQAAHSGKKSTVVFLGDNIYPAGLPKKEHPERKNAESYIKSQLNSVKDYEGKVYFIAGNHDWNEYAAGGVGAVKRQKKFIEKYLDRKNVFNPEPGCGDPFVKELTDDLTLILIDSQWYLHDWEKEPEINKGCEIKSRADFERKLTEIVDDYDDGNILIATHHPSYSNGTHGGYYPFVDHIFPLRHVKKGLWLPLPVIGSLYPLLRHLGISSQDINNSFYQEYVNSLETATFRKPNVVIAAGHEHNLQYFHKDSKHYIVSGAGSKSSYIRKGQDACFSYQKQGFAKLIYCHDGQIVMEMWAPEGEGKTGKLLYRKVLKESTLSAERMKNPQPLVYADSVEVQADPTGKYRATNSKKGLLGTLNRKAWEARVRVPVLDLTQKHGGLQPLKRGGGMQTRSLRLQAPDGRQYVLRSVSKDVTPLIPIYARGTFIEAVMQDFLSSSHPYSAWVVPPLANAAGVFHTNPDFYFLPEQPSLGDFNEAFADDLYLFEERPAKNREELASFGNSKKIVSYRKMLRKTHDSHKHRVDQKQTLRSRVFDIWIGDWDRHEDQWRWARFNEWNYTVYKPIPRDRDQVFVSVNGFIPHFLTSSWAARLIQGFDYEVRDIKGLNFNPRFFDRSFLTEQDHDDWKNMALDLQARLTDSVIESAFLRWPSVLYELDAEKIIDMLKHRRDRLPVFIDDYYRYLAKTVDVVGTDKRERFFIERLESGETLVQMHYLTKKGKKQEKIYERVFDPEITKEIRLYGLKGKDQFQLYGKAPKGSLIRIIGGENKDEVEDHSQVGGGKRTVVYDLPEGVKVKGGKETRLRLKNDPKTVLYDRTEFRLNHFLPLIIPGFNIDDGFNIGAGFMATVHGFRKRPYKALHTLTASYAFATQATIARYQGDFRQVFGKTGIHLDVVFNSPSFTRNWFGFGNETTYTDTDDEERDFNRLRMAQVLLSPSFQHIGNQDMHIFRWGPRYQFTEVERNEDRIDSDERGGLIDADFDPKHYAGAGFSYRLNGTDNGFNPRRGIRAEAQAQWMANLEDTDMNFANFSGNISLYYTFNLPTKLTLASRVGAEHITGNVREDFEFFQMPHIGRRDGLRGFRGERFAGESTFFLNNDLRMDVAKIRFILPMRVGIFGFFDYGRVWFSGDNNSNTWHRGYGGGVSLSPFDQIVITFDYAKSNELGIIEFRLGHFF